MSAGAQEPTSLAARAPEITGSSPSLPSLPLDVELLPVPPPGEPPAFQPGRFPLATVLFGEGSPRTPPGGGLCLRVPLIPLGREAIEVWSTHERPSKRPVPGLSAFATEELMFGEVELERMDLERATFSGFRTLLAAIQRSGYPHLLRTWNTLPDIHARLGELDRYKVFCRARSLAFEEAWGAGFERRLCASTAVGSRSGPQVLYFLAARRNGRHIENRRQISAFRYPPCHGPRPPSFARATCTPPGLGGDILVSGTASIVGHASAHPDRLGPQVSETLRNMVELVGTQRLRLLKVYLRRPTDLEAVQRVLRHEFPDHPRTLFLRADICRPELLVEIEGLGRHRDPPTVIQRWEP